MAIGSISLAQEVDIRGGFVQDSLKIGANMEYWLSARYPSKLDLMLPDSNFNFTPFEFGGRQYFETLADSTIALDSVVYQLQSFEIDPVQYLNLPAIIVTGKDSTIITSPLDSIFLIELVEVATDTTALKTNTELQDLPGQFNSPLLMIILGALVLIIIVVLIVFGKKIARHFKLKRMARTHEQFLSKIGKLITEMKGNGTPEKAEDCINLWKKYLEKLERKPFTKWTSKEIVAHDFAEELTEPLKAVDRCVYGKISSDSVYQDFQHLEDFASNRYEDKVNKLKQGE